MTRASENRRVCCQFPLFRRRRRGKTAKKGLKIRRILCVLASPGYFFTANFGSGILIGERFGELPAIRRLIETLGSARCGVELTMDWKRIIKRFFAGGPSHKPILLALTPTNSYLPLVKVLWYPTGALVTSFCQRSSVQSFLRLFHPRIYLHLHGELTAVHAALR